MSRTKQQPRKRPTVDTEPKQGQVLDDNEQAVQNQPLNFNEDDARPDGNPDPRDRIPPNQINERVREAGLTDASFPDQGATMDDVTPETMMPDDGARSPNERGRSRAADQTLTEVDEEDIGGGHGLDEAELGRVKPLDDKPWDGDPDEPLGG